MPMASDGCRIVVRNETAFHFFVAIWTGAYLIHLGFPVASVVSGNWSVCNAPRKRVYHNRSCSHGPLGASLDQA